MREEELQRGERSRWLVSEIWSVLDDESVIGTVGGRGEVGVGQGRREKGDNSECKTKGF